MKKLLMSLLVGLFAFAAPAMAEEGVHKLVLQITDDNPQKMNTVLNVINNITKHYQEQGEIIEVEVVAFNKGLHMLRADTSPVAKRLKAFQQSMPDVQFSACGNTLQGMAKKEGKEPPLLEVATMVPAGVGRLMELSEAGWTIIRP